MIVSTSCGIEPNRVIDESGDEVPRGNIGTICFKLPLPPGTLLHT